MSNPKYKKLTADGPAGNGNPSPGSEEQPEKESDMPEPPGGPPPAVSFWVPPPEPSKSHPSPYGPPEAGSHQQAALPSARTTVITPVEPSEEPDFVAFSIGSTLFCCIILGSIAYIFSKRTQRANLIGDRKAAQRNSKIAFVLSIASLVAGVVIWIVYITFRMRS